MFTVGRPPGSKSKSKLEAKWMTQMAQGILRSPSPSNSPPPPLTPITPDTSSTDSSSLTERAMPTLIPTTDSNKTFKPFLSAINVDKHKKSTTNSSPIKTTISAQG